MHSQTTSQPRDTFRATALRSAAVLAAALMLGACQGGVDARPAARAMPAEVPQGLPAALDPAACWQTTRVTLPGGAQEDRMLAVPCPDATDAYFWTTLQRALAVRGLYAGPVNGIPDEVLREGIRRYQAPQGLDSPVLSLDAARQLGLLAWPEALL